MKKSLFTICGALAVSAIMAQTPSPSWTITQNSNFPMVSAGTRFIDAVNPNVVWAVGYDGTAPSRNYSYFTRTTNGGTSFSSGIIFQGTNTAVGDTNSWVLANMEGIDANTAWVSAYKKSSQNMGGIFRTTNGGTNWINMTAPGMFTNTASFADVITFVTPSVGVAIGDPNGTGNEFEIWRTIDGGNSWTKIPGANIPNPSSTNEFGLVNVYCKQGTSNIWFGTNAGRIYRSTDGGLTWSVATVAASTTGINDIAFTDPNNGVAYAFTSGSTFEMYNTTDGGATWTQIVTPSPNVGMNDLNAVPGTNYFVSAGAGTGNNIISYSQDNGVTWTDWGSISIQYLNIDFADGANGWAGSFSDPANAAVGGIYKYSDIALTSTIAPTAAFTLPSYLCSTGGAATVTPTDMSTGTAPLSYSWSAAGALVASSTSSAPIISFTANGTYTVTLNLTNTYGSNSSSQVINVLTCSPPTAAFSVPTNSVCQKVAINFTNTSTGAPTPTFSWTTSPAANVTISPSPSASNAAITFSTPGTYSVTLWASNAGGTAQVTQTIVISNCAPVAGFTIPATGCVNTAISATN
ncbi:MAG: VPS10 domain-containing protein, partial [Bacteroidia bacterium]